MQYIVINCKRIVKIIFNEERCIPIEKELESFFYGQAYINKFFGERGNYKIKGKKKYEGFKKMITNIVFYLLILLIYIGIMIKQLK